jgi:uncharacterized protein YndB with AHSA1/START domain
VVPVTVHTAISASREEVFDFLMDLGNRPAWLDHCMSEFRLAHPNAQGKGAAARFLLDAPRLRQWWVETQIAEAERPHRLVEATRAGRLGRTRGAWEYELSRHGKGLTRVELTIWSQVATPRERLMEKLGARGWTKRQAKIALERLRSVFEERPDGPLARATVAGWEPQKAARFGVGPGPEPRAHTGSGERASSG